MALLILHRTKVLQAALDFPDQFRLMLEQEKVPAGENPCVTVVGALLRPAVELGQGDVRVIFSGEYRDRAG